VDVGCVYWLTPVIVATWEAEIRRIVVQGQTGQKFYETLISISSWVPWRESVIPVMVGSVTRRMVAQREKGLKAWLNW
jgi:hypothetical protein